MLTIFIPSYNHSDYIIECLKNIQKISIKNKKIIIIDDASKDDSVLKINLFIKNEDKNGEIIFIEKRKNKGVIDSLNLFLSMVETEYIYLMASDDITVPDGIEKIVSILEINKRLKFVIGGGVNIFNNGKETPVYSKAHQVFFDLPPPIRNRRVFLDLPGPLLSQSTIIRASALRDIGGWDPRLKEDDVQMFIKLLTNFSVKGLDFDFLPEILCVKYRHHDSNSYSKFERQLLIKVQTLKYLCPENLKRRAIGYKLSYYVLYSLSKGKYSILPKLLFIAPISSWGWAMLGGVKHIYSRLKKR